MVGATVLVVGGAAVVVGGAVVAGAVVVVVGAAVVEVVVVATRCRSVVDEARSVVGVATADPCAPTSSEDGSQPIKVETATSTRIGATARRNRRSIAMQPLSAEQRGS